MASRARCQDYSGKIGAASATTRHLPLVYDALEAAADRDPRVLALHIADGAFEGGERHPFVGVLLDASCDENSRRRALAALSEAARPHVTAGMLLDVVALTPDMLRLIDAGIGEAMWQRRQ